jgi:DNA-binding NarL/FixJ family response regulator
MNAREIKILLVDDHPMLRQGVRFTLSQQPDLRVVGEASNGADALCQVRALGPDVVVMDVHLPDEDGIKASEAILAEFPQTKIVVLSADTNLATVHSALQAGLSAYITKEGPSEDLVRAIREVMDQRIYLCPEISSLVVQDYMQTVIKRAPTTKYALTDRERTLLKLVAEGKRNKEIAEVLQVGVSSVETYRSRLMRKLNCGSAADLTRYAIREGISSP